MRDVLKGLEMCDKHIYKVTRWNNGKGGASKIPNNIIANEVMALVCGKVHNIMPLLPDKFRDVKPRDFWIPDETWKSMKRINAYLGYHGDSSVIAVTLLDTIIDMTRYGIHDVKQYRGFVELLDATQPETFEDFIQICVEYEKEMKR